MKKQPAKKAVQAKAKAKAVTQRFVDRLKLRDLLEQLDADSPAIALPDSDRDNELKLLSARDFFTKYNSGELVVMSRAVLRRIIKAL